MSTDDETRATIRQLKKRVDALETTLHNLAIRAGCAIVGILLVAGLLIPFGYSTERGEPFNPSVVSMPWRMIANAGEADTDGEELVFGILVIVGFLGLLAVVISMLCTLLVIVGRDASARAVRFARVLRVLAIIGAIVVLIFTVLHMNDKLPDTSPGIGGVVLLIGVLGYALLLTEPVRDLWNSPATATTRPLRERHLANARRSASAQPRDDTGSSTGR